VALNASARLYGLAPRTGVTRGSGRDWRLIRPATMGQPAILTDACLCAVFARTWFGRQPAQPRVRAMPVKVPLEINEFHLQISSRPEQRPVETFAANCADQAFDKWMRQRRVRYRLDRFHLEDSQIRLPLVESLQRIMIRAEVGRRRLPTNRSIEHAAQRHAIHDAAVHAKAHDPSRALVHHDEHPVGVQDGRFAPKQIKTPETALRVTKHCEPGRLRRVLLWPVPRGENAPTTSLFMGIPKARVICCAIRGHPQVGFHCFMSTTAAMTSGLGPLGPGFAVF
jgi:hypothetical protein